MERNRLSTYLRLAGILLLLAVPFLLQGQNRWSRTETFYDRQAKGKLVPVGKVTFSASWMNSPLAPGEFVKGAAGAPEPIVFNRQPDGYLKIEIESLKWTDEGRTEELIPDYKVVFRRVWADLDPPIYRDKLKSMPNLSVDQAKKLYINAQNYEYVNGEQMPPPFIYKIDQNNNYLFTIGMVAITPKTKEEKPYYIQFPFTIDGLIRDGKGFNTVEEEPVVIDEGPVEEPEEEPDWSEIDELVAQAIEDERADLLIDLINKYPQVPSVRDARKELEITMLRELIDSVTYEVDIRYKRFSRTAPRPEDLKLDFYQGGRNLGPNERPYYTWKGNTLIVRPDRDSIDYTLRATMIATPENKAEITLNSVKDFINFTFGDTLNGESVTLHIKGGSGPYILHLQSKKGEDFFEVEGAIRIDGDTVISKAKLAKAFGLTEEGDFRMYVEDSDQLKKTGIGLVHIVPPPPIPPEVWYISLAALGAFFLGFLIWRRRKRKKDKEMEELLMSRGGDKPKVKRKPKPNLKGFWAETAISDLSLHKNFVRDLSTYLKERQPNESGKPAFEGVILGTVLKFDFENEQYEVRLDRFRAVERRPLDFYEDKMDSQEKWVEIREVAEHHKNLVKIGWLQVVEDETLRLGKPEMQFQDEEFSELFQLVLKINIGHTEDGKQFRECGFFTRTISGKVNNARDRRPEVDYWMDWDRLEDAGYYQDTLRPIMNKSISLEPEEDEEEMEADVV